MRRIASTPARVVKLTGGKIVGDDVRGHVSSEHLERVDTSLVDSSLRLLDGVKGMGWDGGAR